MSKQLRELMTAGAFAPIDVHLARCLGELVPGTPPPVLHAAALVSRATREGHACVELARLAAPALVDAEGAPLSLAMPPAPELDALLAASALVGDGERPTPLVRDRGRLYLARLWHHERALAAALLERATPAAEPLLPEVAQESLARLFGPRPAVADPQRIAAALVALRALTVITGGPGTGKTATVVRVVALLAEQALAAGRPLPRVLLLAPTGKAAARLVESIRGAQARLDLAPGVVAGIPTQAQTLHRALGQGAGRGRSGVLAAELVVVDEASMVDLELMRRLVAAVPRRARLVLLGDRHQLASVEAGAVLADLAGPSPRPPYSRALAETVLSAFGEVLPGAGAGPGGLADSVVELTRSHRFDAQSGIGRLAAATLAGDFAAARAALAAEGLALVPPAADGRLGRGFAPVVAAGFAPYLAAREPAAALAALGGFRVLTVHRRGREGLVALNPRIEALLAAQGQLRPGRGPYHLRPVLITANDYEIGLHNGDVAVTFRAPGSERLRVWVTGADGALRALAPARLPAHESLFAMSVHKSQGSEFDEVAVVLPDASSPLLTRELVYTAVTRARRRVTLFGSEASLAAALARPIERATGLAGLLWGEG